MEGMGDSVVVRRTVTTTTGTDGRTSSTTADDTVTGVHVAMVSFAEAEVASARGMTLDAVVAVPNAGWAQTVWRTGAEVIISGKGAPLDGTYRIQAIRQTQLHRRVLLSRVETRGR